MPTYDKTDTFQADWKKLDGGDRARFLAVVQERFIPDLATGGFRRGLRVKRVLGAGSGVFEMTWAPDGRATWEYGPEKTPGEPHVVWRRVGTHDVLNSA